VSGRLRGRLAAIALVSLTACQAGSPAEAPDADVGTSQRPPRGQADLEAWLAQGFYKSWTCEATIFPPRLSGNHGRQRICANDLLLGSTAGTYPVGSSSVKELFDDGDRPNGYAVGLKIEAADGPQTWYWYERRGTDPSARPKADGQALPDCAVCHQTAARDYVFIRPQP
jgi:predicted small lipoprotein YifL